MPYILTCSDDMLIKLWDWDKVRAAAGFFVPVLARGQAYPHALTRMYGMHAYILWAEGRTADMLSRLCNASRVGGDYRHAVVLQHVVQELCVPRAAYICMSVLVVYRLRPVPFMLGDG
jgi:hypothetical protein